MNIGIYAASENYLSENELVKLICLSEKYNFHLFFNEEYVNGLKNRQNFEFKCYSQDKDVLNSVSYFISYGGDGTFLKCVREVAGFDIPILGINSGNLGFLLSANANNAEDAFDAIFKGEFNVEVRDMLTISGSFDGEMKTIDCFNEFTLQKSGLSMISVEMKILNEKVTTYKADGLIISTPSGSTAYSLSVGGPIVSPDCNCFIITPIAPHNLTMRPLIVSNNSIISLKVNSRIEPSFATVDNMSFNAYNNAEFTVELSKIKAKIIKLKSDSYFKTLTKKLMWGRES
ncbi:MAG: NAD(+)/NADH kinase [Rikenellaceae bacterium]